MLVYQKVYVHSSFLPQTYLVLGATLSSPSSDHRRSHLSLRMMWRCWKPPMKGSNSQSVWVKILHGGLHKWVDPKMDGLERKTKDNG